MCKGPGDLGCESPWWISNRSMIPSRYSLFSLQDAVLPLSIERRDVTSIRVSRVEETSHLRS